MPAPILQVENLQAYFYTPSGPARAVDGVSFILQPGETLGLVGESGCGKTATALSVLRLLPDPPARIVGGQVLFGGQNLSALTEAELCRIRGKHISMVFQEPMSSLNPVLRIGDQISEPLRLHLGLRKKEAREKAVEYLRLVGIADPERCVDSYPHQLSGGMRQRAMIAGALCCRPQVLIADEPTTALDVTIQAQILELITELKKSLGMAMLLITHDLGVVANIADRIAIMYAGQIVEQAPTGELFSQPLHPYTQGLLASLPTLEHKGNHQRLHAIPGSGCRFNPRCPKVLPKCHREEPQLEVIKEGHEARCWNISLGDVTK